jgi:hypothetical protein
MATGREVQQMDDAAKELRRHMDPAVVWATESEQNVFSSWLLNDAERQIVGAIKNTRALAEQWLTTWRGWAERGMDDKGEAYSVSFYLRVGQDLASAFAAYMKQQVIADAFVLGQTVEQTGVDISAGLVRVGAAAGNVLQAAEEFSGALAKPWPAWVKVGVTFGALGLGALAVRALVRQVPGVGGSRKGAT